MNYKPFLEDARLCAHIESLQPKPTPAPRRKRNNHPMNTPANTETGTIAFFDARKSFGFCIPDGADPTDRSQSLYVSGAALQRAGIATIEKGTRIRYRREQPKHAGRKCETQDIRLLDAA
jgi:cold shock CspA family protein